MSRIIIIEDEMANIFIYKVEIVTKKKSGRNLSSADGAEGSKPIVYDNLMPGRWS